MHLTGPAGRGYDFSRHHAHSRPENLASARVLEKSGFRRVGQVIDPEDGLVCRWELREQAKRTEMGAS